MGDRTWAVNVPCPKCGAPTEQFDAPSCLQWVWHCDECGWADPRDYYEVREGVIDLMTAEEARALGILKDCPDCGDAMTGVDEKYCFECGQKKTAPSGMAP